MEVILGKDRSGEGPFVFASPFESLPGVANIQLNPRAVLPAIVDTFQEVVEEALLVVAAVGGVEVGPVSVPMNFEPLAVRRCMYEPVEVASGMDALPAQLAAVNKGTSTFPRPMLRAWCHSSSAPASR